MLATSHPTILSARVLEYPFSLRSRRWSRGAVIRNLGKNGLAEQAGCKAGDIIVTWNPWMDTLKCGRCFGKVKREAAFRIEKLAPKW